MKKSFIILGLLLYFSSNCFSQENSYRLNSIWGEITHGSIKSESELSLEGATITAGFHHAFPFNNSNFLIEVGTDLEWNSYSRGDAGSKDFDRIIMEFLGIKVPLNALYRIEFKKFTLYPFAGINAKYYAFGNILKDGSYAEGVYRKDYSTTYNMFKDEGEEIAHNRTSIGYQLGLRAQFSRFLISIGYTRNIFRLSNDLDGIKGISFGVGYSF